MTRRIAAVAAVLFGVVTLVAGGRVLLGGDPGYLVFRPLVLFNTAMGAVYVLAGILIWRTPAAVRPAAAIALLNGVVLAGIVALRLAGGPVAGESVAAMTFRTAVWAAIWGALVWGGRRSAARRPVSGPEDS
ncbi:MAG TPA: hypothetical protein VFZ26_14695 [Gemmatimonadales bacterium]